MARLSRLLFPVFPGNGLFHVYGPGARAGGADISGLAGGSLLASGFDHLELSTLQGRVDVNVILEEWDLAPAEASCGGWEETASTTVFLRGQVIVSGNIPGRSVRHQLLGGSGPYRAEVYARQRRAVAERYDQLLHRYRDPHSVEFRIAEQGLRGREEFLIRLWPAVAHDGPHPAGDVRFPTAVSG
ncbi:hypothetical protein GCM10009799_46510 [Nocardiopsis rhodophaea]|uniref:Uncharacterized protein n=1 Tax=Nocardiopsis rhodophaea TaxID=280238 RepID=A0ABP5EZW3_9ACTN